MKLIFLNCIIVCSLHSLIASSDMSNGSEKQEIKWRDELVTVPHGIVFRHRQLPNLIAGLQGVKGVAKLQRFEYEPLITTDSSSLNSNFEKYRIREVVSDGSIVGASRAGFKLIYSDTGKEVSSYSTFETLQAATAVLLRLCST